MPDGQESNSGVRHPLMKAGVFCLVLACTSSALAAATVQSGVSVRQLPSGIYELTLTVQNTTDVRVAQQARLV